MPTFDYSPDAEIRRLPTLVLVDHDGVETTVPEGGIVFAAGANIELDLPDEGDTATISSIAGGGGEDNYYRLKYEGLAATPDTGSVTGGGEDAAHPAWEFTAAARWIGAINQVPAFAVDGNFFLANSVCSSTGLFESASGYPESSAALLTLTDVCAPAINNLTLARLSTYIQRLRECLDYLLAICNNSDPSYTPTPPTGITASGYNNILQQFMTVRNYWNYLIHRFSVRFNAISQGQSIVLAHYYRNSGSAAVGDVATGISVSILCSFLRNEAGVETPWLGLLGSGTLVKLLRRNDADDPPTSLIPYTWSYTVDTSSILISANTVEGATVHDLDAGSEFLADFAIMFKSMNLPEDGAEYYMVATSVVSPTHMSASVEREQRVYFTPPIVEPEA